MAHLRCLEEDNYIKCMCVLELIGLTVLQQRSWQRYLFGSPLSSCRRDPPQENGRKRTLMVYPRVVKVSTADNTNSFLPPDVASKINSTFVRPWDLNPVGHVANLRLNKRMTGFGKRPAPDSHVYDCVCDTADRPRNCYICSLVFRILLVWHFTYYY